MAVVQTASLGQKVLMVRKSKAVFHLSPEIRMYIVSGKPAEPSSIIQKPHRRRDKDKQKGGKVVINLWDRKLTKAKISLLENGLTFEPAHEIMVLIT